MAQDAKADGWSSGSHPRVGLTVVEKHCAKCSLPFECLAPSSECWCQTIKVFPRIHDQATKQYADCLCKLRLSLMFFPPDQLCSAWDEVKTWAQGPSVAFHGYSMRLTRGSEVWWDIVLSTDHPSFKGCDIRVVTDFQ